jgi:hypothetical protein
VKNGADHYDGALPTRRQRRRNRVILNPCEPCAQMDPPRERRAKCTVRVEDGRDVDVCMWHRLKMADEIWTEALEEMV